MYRYTRVEGPPRRARRLMMMMMTMMMLMMTMMMIRIMIYHWRPPGAHHSGPAKIGNGITLP